MRHPYRVSVAVAGLAISALIILVALVGNPSSAIALTDVKSEVASTKSVSYRQTVNTPIGEKKEVFTPVTETRITVLASGVFRAEHSGGVVTISNPRKGRLLQLDTRNKEARLSSFPAETRDFYEQIRSVRPENAAKVEEKVVGGKQVLGFIVRGTESDDPDGFREGTRIWVDEETRLPVEIEFPPVGPQKLEVVWVDFQFDEPIDEKLFSLEPPEGYKVVPDQE